MSSESGDRFLEVVGWVAWQMGIGHFYIVDGTKTSVVLVPSCGGEVMSKSAEKWTIGLNFGFRTATGSRVLLRFKDGVAATQAKMKGAPIRVGVIVTGAPLLSPISKVNKGQNLFRVRERTSRRDLNTLNPHTQITKATPHAAQLVLRNQVKSNFYRTYRIFHYDLHTLCLAFEDLCFDFLHLERVIIMEKLKAACMKNSFSESYTRTETLVKRKRPAGDILMMQSIRRRSGVVCTAS